jgi:hypothetical protein
MAAPGADLAETPEQGFGIDITVIDPCGKRRQILPCDGADLIGNRWRGPIGSFQTRYRK